MFAKSTEDNLDCWVGRTATIMVCVGGGLALLMMSTVIAALVM